MAHIFIGSDHAGFQLKNQIVTFLASEQHTVEDLGVDSPTSCDYPNIAHAVCTKVLENTESFGILICGTGIGMSMAANRKHGIRAALCGCEFQAKATRAHNNANVLCLGERVTGSGVAMEMVRLFLATPFDGGRHLQRVQLFDTHM